MSLASPERLMWLVVALPIIGFYILKTRLRRRQVATLLFWDQLFEEKRQRSLWQNLRHWLSLLLQLIFVGLLGFAIADPLWQTQSESGQELILVIDNSASMRAVDPATNTSRLEDAVSKAVDIAKGLRQGDQISLMTAGSSVRVVVGMTDFAPAVQEALRDIKATDGPTKVYEAIEAARRLASDSGRRRIIVFTDGCVTDRKALVNAEDVRWVLVGKPQDNLAITIFQVRRSTTDPIGYALLVEVQNLGDEAANARLKLTLGDSLVDVIPIKLAANGTYRKTIDGTSREGGVLTGTLDVEDGLRTDNVAQAIVPARPLVPVTLVSETDSDSFYLRSVLSSIPLVQLSETTDALSLTEDPNRLTVYSGVSPEQIPAGPSLFVVGSGVGPKVDSDDVKVDAWRIGEATESPIVAKQNKESPLLRHVRLQNVVLAGGRDVDVNALIGEPTTLLETAEGSRVLVSVERQEGRLLILAADLDSSDLPLRIAFPVMMTNAMNWFFRETGDMNPALSTGKLVSVPWDVSADNETGVATLIAPNGEERLVTVNNEQATVGPLDQVGVFALLQPASMEELADDDVTLTPQEWLAKNATGDLLAVNLCDASESDLRVPELSSQETTAPPISGASAWFYLAMLGLGLVIGEWVLFNRRVIA